MKKLTFEIRSPAHQQNAIQAIQRILPDPTKPIVVIIQERNRSLDQNRKLWACLGDVSRQVEWHGRWLDAESWKCVFICGFSGINLLNREHVGINPWSF